MDGAAPHGDGQGLPLEPLSLALGAGALAHALLDLPLHGVRLGFPVAALQVVDNALEGLVQGALAPGLVVVQGELLPLGAVQDDIHHLIRQLLHRVAELEAVLFGQGVEVHPGDAVGLDVVPARGGDGPLQNGQGTVWEDALRVDLHLAAQPGAGGTGPVGVVEGEHPGGELLNGYPAVLAGVVLGKGDIPLIVPQHVDDHDAAGQGGGGLHAVGEPPGHVLPDHQPVHHDLDGVLAVLVQLDLLGEVVQGAVRPHPDIAGFPGVLKDFGVLALLAPDDGGEHLDAGGLGEGHHLVDDLVDGLLLDLLAALGAVGGAHPGPQQAEVVVNLGDGANGGPGVFGGGFLVDGDGGGQSLNVVHVGLLHLAQKHSGVGGQGFHIPPLALGVQGLEGQGGLPRPGQPGEHHQLVPRDLHVDIFQVVFSRAFDNDLVLHGCSPRFSLILGPDISIPKPIFNVNPNFRGIFWGFHRAGAGVHTEPGRGAPRRTA